MTKLVTGLGNPGDKYKNTRHNVGFMVVDELVSQLINEEWPKVKKFDSLIIIHQPSTIFAKPQTFMNSSGLSVKKIVVHYKVKMPDLWIIHDDLDLRLGDYKIQQGVGPKLHYGIQSIEEKLGKKDFWRVRIGVDNRLKDNRIPGESYVLQTFSEDEKATLSKLIAQVVPQLMLQLKKDGDR